MQNPPQKGGFFYFTGVVAQQVAREGFSGEMWVKGPFSQNLLIDELIGG